VKPVAQYLVMDQDQLRAELVQVVYDLVFNIKEHATLSADYHVEFSKSWAQSAGGSVAAKERDAEHQQKDTMFEIIDRKGMIDALTAERDLLLCLIK
jgi:hypothetical protein